MEETLSRTLYNAVSSGLWHDMQYLAKKEACVSKDTKFKREIMLECV